MRGRGNRRKTQRRRVRRGLARRVRTRRARQPRRRSPGPNAKPNASSSSDSASTVALPLVTYGVRPAVPSIRTSSEPIVERLQPADHAALRIDRGRHPGVRRAQHRPAGFQRAHPRDLQVLVECDRIAEPREIRHVDEHARRHRIVADRRRDFLAEDVFVADVGHHRLIAHDERLLHRRAAREIAERHLHQIDEPVKAPRDELAERHQVVLVVAVDVARVRRHAVQAVRVVDDPAVGRHGAADRAEQHRRVGRVAEIAHRARERLGQLLDEHRDRRLGRDDEIGGFLGDHLLVHLDRRLDACLLELDVLLHVALEQAHRERRVRGHGPRHEREQRAERERGKRRERRRRDARRPRRGAGARGGPAVSAAVVAKAAVPAAAFARADDRLHDERRDEREHPADAVDADDRRIARKRPVDLRVAAREPRKAGEHGAAQPFADGPRARERERAVPGRRERARVDRLAVSRVPRAERPEPRGERRIDRQIQAEQHERAARERRGHLAVHVHADVEPPDAGDEVAEAERAARGRRVLPARRARELREQPREHDELQPAAVRRRRERQRVRSTREERGRIVPDGQRTAGGR